MRSLPRPLAGAFVALLTVAACGGAPAATPNPTVAASTGPTPKPTPVVTTVTVGKSIWFAGFKVTVDTGTSTIDATGGSVIFDAKFENLGAGTQSLDATIVLDSAGVTASTDDFNNDIPSVPAGGTGKGKLAFDVGPEFTFTNAVLTFGQPANNRAMIPLGTAGTLVTLEPVAVNVAGKSGTAGDIKIALQSAELRADLPKTYRQEPKESMNLTFIYDVTFNSDFAGGFAFTGDNVALKLPDGTTAAPRADGNSQSIELLSARATTKNLFSSFDVDNPAAGQYMFIVRDGTDTMEIAFTIP